MKRIVLDSCILVHYLTKNTIAEKIENELHITDADCIPVISSVTKGELISFAKQRKWGKNKLETLDVLLNNAIIIDIASKDKDLMDNYAYIDSYSKRKIPDENGNLLNGSAVKMGKNDLWIAATAKVIEAPLVTTDKDFLHLKGEILDLHYYEIENDIVNNHI